MQENIWRVQQPLHIIHSDFCGPIQTQSLGKSSYFITFIDDYKWMCWVYFFKTKDESFDTFKRFKTCVENEKGNMIKF